MKDKFIKIEYMKRKDVNLELNNASTEARAVLEIANPEDNLILKISINNASVYIEDVAPLTLEGIRKVVRIEQEEKK